MLLHKSENLAPGGLNIKPTAKSTFIYVVVIMLPFGQFSQFDVQALKLFY
jgi:hypothetical protein